MHAGVAHLLGPGREAIVELLEVGDAVRLSLEQEPLSDVAQKSFLFAARLRPVGPTVDQPDAQHGAAALEGGIAIRRSVVHQQLFRHTAALDRGAQHVLAGAGVLVRQPTPMHEESAVVVDEHPQKGTFAAGHAWIWHEWTDEHIPDPALIGTFGFVATERARLASQGRAMQTASAQVLADGPLGHVDALPRFQNRGDLSGGTCWQLQSELAGLLQQLRVATHRAEVGAWWRTQTIQTLLAVGANPAIERAAGIGPLAAIWMVMRLAGPLRHQLATFSRREAPVRCGGDHRVTEQGDSFAGISAHEPPPGALRE